MCIHTIRLSIPLPNPIDDTMLETKIRLSLTPTELLLSYVRIVYKWLPCGVIQLEQSIYFFWWLIQRAGNNDVVYAV